MLNSGEVPLLAGGGRGELEVWPAGSSTAGYDSVAGSPSGRSGAARRAKVGPKPALLVNLEGFIEQRIASLPMELRAVLSEERLAVYSEALDGFLREFPTYAPLLSRIRRQYDAMMAHYRRQLADLEPLQRRLEQMKAEEAETVAGLEEAHRASVASVKKLIESSSADCASLETGVQNVRDKLLLQQKALRETEDANEEQVVSNRSILLSMQAIIARQKTREDPAAAEGRRAKQKADLEHAQDQLTKALVAFNKLKLLQQTLVPAAEVQAANNELNRVLRQIQNLTKQTADLRKEAEDLEERTRATAAKIEAADQERAQLEEKTRSFTPRPDWGRLPSYSADVALEGMASREISVEMYRVIDKLRDDLTDFNKLLYKSRKAGGEDPDEDLDEASEDRFIEGLGADPSVPKYLRFKGKIRNKNFKKRDTEILIKEVIKSKLEYQKSSKKAVSMEDWLFTFLQKRVGQNGSKALFEYGYNLVNALERYQSDPDCRLFHLMLQDKASQEVWDRGETLLDDLLKCIIAVDVAASKQQHQLAFASSTSLGLPSMPATPRASASYTALDAMAATAVTPTKEGPGKNPSSSSFSKAHETGIVAKEDLLVALRKFFHAKSDERFLALAAALESDQAGPFVEYRNLFLEDRDGNQGEFIEAVRNQYMEEREAYIEDITRAIEHEAQGEARISYARIARALEAVDPEKPQPEWAELIAKGFGLEVRELKDNKLVNVADFLKRMTHGVIERTTRED